MNYLTWCLKFQLILKSVLMKVKSFKVVSRRIVLERKNFKTKYIIIRMLHAVEGE